MIKTKIFIFLAFMFFISLICIVTIEWSEFFLNTSFNFKSSIRAFFLITFFFVIIVSKKLSPEWKFELYAPLLVLGFMFIVYAIFEENTFDGFYYSLRIIYWIVGVYFVYKCLVLGIIKEKYIYVTCYTIVFIYFLFIMILLFSAEYKFSQNVKIYVIMWIIPILMLNKHDKIVNIFLLFCVISIVVTMKRGAVFAMLLSFIAYSIAAVFIHKSLKLFSKNLLAYVCLLIVAVCSLYLVYDARPDFFIKRTSDIVESDKALGSGREDLYPYIISKFAENSNRSMLNFFIGNGSRSVQQIADGYYAHSDWLQLLYDYGLVGIIVLFWIHVKFLHLIYLSVKQKFEFSPDLVMCYVMFFLLNTYSGMIFSANSIYFGIFIALYYYKWNKWKYIKNNARVGF